MISVKGVTVQRNGLTVVSDASLSTRSGRTIALVGSNGVGKSTLLQVMAGMIKPSRGTVQTTEGERVAYVRQDFATTGDETVLDYLKGRTGLLELEAEVEAYLSLPEADQADGKKIQRFVDAQAAFDALGGNDFDSTLQKVLADVGLDGSVAGRRMGELSGGQQVKVGLAGTLMSKFDVLLLDEPTNNLDLKGLELLERYIKNSPAGIVIVSHDRRLLDNVADAVAEITVQHEVVYYGFGYAAYRAARSRDLAAKSRVYQDYQDKVATLTAALRRAETQVARRASSAADGDKTAAHYRAERGNSSAAGAKRRAQRALESLPAVAAPVDSWKLRFELKPASRCANQAVSIRACMVSYPGFTLGPVSMEIESGDRVAIIGPNGAGKTTLVNLITGCLSPEQGQVQLGAGVRMGRVDQDQSLTLGHATVLESFRHETGERDQGAARTLLAKFGLGADEVLRPAEALSPGQRARLMLAVLSAQCPNVLVLDEPTNHLDLEGQEQLEAAVIEYLEAGGTLIVVSHDREFLERVGATGMMYEVDKGKVESVSY